MFFGLPDLPFGSCVSSGPCADHDVLAALAFAFACGAGPCGDDMGSCADDDGISALWFIRIIAILQALHQES